MSAAGDLQHLREQNRSEELRNEARKLDLQRQRQIYFDRWVTRLIYIIQWAIVVLLLYWPIGRLADAFEVATGQKTEISVNIAVTITITLTISVAGLYGYTRHLKAAVKKLRSEIEELKRENQTLQLQVATTQGGDGGR